MVDKRLPAYYQELREASPSAFLFELQLAEYYLTIKKKGANGENSPRMPKTDNEDFTNFLQIVEEDLATATPADDQFIHSSMGRELLAELEAEHKRLVDDEHGNPFYKVLYEKTLPSLVELGKKFPEQKSVSEIARFQQVLFFYMTLEMAGKTPSNATMESLKGIVDLMHALGELRAKRKMAEATQAQNQIGEWD